MLKILAYTKDFKKTWDNFVLEESCNGTFLQSWKFLDYHPQGRFVDASFFVKNEKDQIVAVVSGCVVEEEGKRVFFSHKGSTFGGIVISRKSYRAGDVFEIIDAVEAHLQGEGFDKVVLKQSSSLFATVNMDLLEYCFFQRGYGSYVELSTYVDFTHHTGDVLDKFSKRKRQYIRNKLAPHQRVVPFTTPEEIGKFHGVLTNNLEKHGAKPIHTVAELEDLIFHRLPEETAVYACYQGDLLLSVALVFLFGHKVAHMQNLVSVQEHVEENGAMFLTYQLFETLTQQGYEKISWGISTEEQGKGINLGLIRVKEDYGSVYSNNRTYFKDLERGET